MYIGIIDILEEIIDSIRENGQITNIVHISGYNYTVTVNDAQSLATGNYINISGSGDFNSSDVLITNVSGNILTVKNDIDSNSNKRTTAPVISTFGTWKANAPYLLTDKFLKGANEILLKSNSELLRNQKYPAIHIVLGIEEKRGESQAVFSRANNILIFFIYESTHDATTEYRRDNIIKPILYPIYEDFINDLLISPKIMQKGGLIEHTYLEECYLSSSTKGFAKENQNQNPYIDVVDAIIINIKELSYYPVNSCN